MNSDGTHFRSCEISYKRVSSSDYTYLITITAYTDSEPVDPVLFGMGELRFGDESNPDEYFNSDGSPSGTPEIQNNTRLIYNSNGSFTIENISEDNGPFISKIEFLIEHTYAEEGSYLISYNEPNRNAGILNIENGNSVNTRMYTESNLQVSNSLNLNHASPLSLTPSVFTNTINKNWSISLAYADSNDYKLRYHLATPKKAVNTEVQNFILPEGVSLNEYTGLFSWDVENDSFAQVGEYIFALAVVQYDFQNGEYVEVGYIVRDFQVILIDDSMPGITVETNTVQDQVLAPNIVQLTVNSQSASGPITYKVVSDKEISYSYKTSIVNNELIIDFTDIPVRTNPYQFIVRSEIEINNNQYVNDRSWLIYSSEIAEPELIFNKEPESVTAIEDEKRNFTFFPNPAKNTISFSRVINNQRLVVHDILGNVVFDLPTFSGEILNINPLKAGLYYLRIGSRSLKFVKID